MGKHAKRDDHFRKNFKSTRTRLRTPRSKHVPGWKPRYAKQVFKSALSLGEVRERTGIKKRGAVAVECRAGRLPLPRFDRISGEPFWHRLEFEAFAFWCRAMNVRHPRGIKNKITDKNNLSNGFMSRSVPMSDFKTLERKTSDKTPEMFNAAVPDKSNQTLLLNMMDGMEAALGVKSIFGIEGGKITHVSLCYPFDLVRVIAQRGSPAGECIERLQARGLTVNVFNIEGVDRLLVMYPIADAIHLAKVWRDDSGDVETATFLVPTSRGVVGGNVELI